MDRETVECPVYRLLPVTDDPIYEGFGFEDNSSIKGDPSGRIAFDFMPENLKSKGRGWAAPRLAHLWSPRKVVGRVRSFNDYPCVNLDIPVFSRRAVDALRHFLVPNGELLALHSEVGEYYVYNTTTVIDALDERRSQIEWIDRDCGVASSIGSFVFRCAALKDASIFRIVQHPSCVYVTQSFVDAAKTASLRGMSFQGTHPGMKHSTSPAEPRTASSVLNPNSTRNTLVVILPTAKPRANKQEKLRVESIKSELDSLLYHPSQSAEQYSGSVEGYDFSDGAFRLFVPCVDADRLADLLRESLISLPWDGPVVVMKRYGQLYDSDCREELAFERA